MIVYLTQGMTRLALRVKETGTRQQLTDWRHLQLLIQPGQHDARGCRPNGSPWFLFGFWPGHPTGVDTANPPHHQFPTICYDAYELDPDGRIVFRLDDKFHALPPGRYSGMLRVYSGGNVPFNLLPFTHLGIPPTPPGPIVPDEFRTGMYGCGVDLPTPSPPPPPPPCCILTVFDIDLGPMCSDHMIDQVGVDFAINTCGEEDGEAS